MPFYEDARAKAATGPTGDLSLAPYSGGTTDLTYLKTYFFGLVNQIFPGLSTSIFNQATEYSAAIMRDVLHRAVYQEHGRTQIDTLLPTGVVEPNDVAPLFRHDATGACGWAAWTLYNVARSLGWQTRDIAGVDWLAGVNSGAAHVTSEVYLVHLRKWVVEDATFNYVIRDSATGMPLNWQEARAVMFGGDNDLVFDGFECQTYYLYDIVTDHILPSVEASLEQDCFDVPYWHMENGATNYGGWLLFPNFRTSQNPRSGQGGMFADATAATNTLQKLQSLGMNWLQIADEMREAGKYVWLRASGHGLALGDCASRERFLFVAQCRSGCEPRRVVGSALGPKVSFQFDRMSSTGEGRFGPDLPPTWRRKACPG